MNSRLSILPILLVFLVIGVSQAQDSYTLKQAIEYGLKNNRSTVVYQNGVEKARYREKEALSTFLPQVNGTGTLDYNPKRQASVLTTSPPMIPGTDGTIVLRAGALYTTNAVVQLDQTIYDQSAIVGVKATKPNRELAELSNEQNDQSLIYNIAYYYYQVFVNTENLKLLQNNKSKYEQLLRVSDLQVAKGTAKRVDRDRIQVSLSNTLAEIANAEQRLVLVKTRLNNVMGLPLDQDVILADTAMLKNHEVTMDNATFNASARVDYKIQQTQILLNDLEMKRIRGTGLPKLTGYARYGTLFLGLNDFKSSFDSRNDYAALGLKLSVPIFDGFKRYSQYHMAKIEWINAQENLFLNQRNYQVEYSNAVTQLTINQSSLVNNERNLELATEVYRITTLQYEQGMASLSDLLNAESSYKDAQINYINSLLNFYLAQLDVQKSNGKLNDFVSELK